MKSATRIIILLLIGALPLIMAAPVYGQSGKAKKENWNHHIIEFSQILLKKESTIEDNIFCFMAEKVAANFAHR